MTKNQIQSLVINRLLLALNARNFDVLDDLTNVDFKYHTPTESDRSRSDLQKFKQEMAQIGNPVSQITFSPEKTVTEKDHVVLYMFIYEGTHANVDAMLLGIMALILKIVDGKLTEVWKVFQPDVLK